MTGTDLVERVSVDLYPNTGQAHQDFGSEGGQIKIPIVTQGGESVEVKWTAQIKFKNPGWPTIPISGKLSAHDGWVQYIKPELWIANFTLVALPVDDEGTRVASTGPNNQVRGVLTLTASYIPVTNILVSSFDASNPVSFTVALPLFPDQPFGDLVLTVFATRDGIVGTQTRKILLTERSIVVSVYPGAQIKISTDRNP